MKVYRNILLSGAAGVTCAAFARSSTGWAGTYAQIGSVNGDISSVLAADSAGNLYGETTIGDGNGGQIFRVARSGASPVHILWIFPLSGGPTFMEPNAPAGGVTLQHTTLLGTTQVGGVYEQGTVFQLSTPTTPTLTILHAFAGAGLDGDDPSTGVTLGLGGLYYGATLGAGVPNNAGTVFATSGSPASPAFMTLHQFGKPGDGQDPTVGRLAVNAQGRLYGETAAGGANGLGTVFMLHHVNGAWQEQVLYSFQAVGDVYSPASNVVVDAQGNVYGCAPGGAHGDGGVFQLAPPAVEGGAWTESILYNFGQQPTDPFVETISYPACGLALNPINGSIAGTSQGGGSDSHGTFFGLQPPTRAVKTWQETVPHSFTSESGNPFAPPLLVEGTYYGGTNRGIIYAYTP